LLVVRQLPFAGRSKQDTTTPIKKTLAIYKDLIASLYLVKISTCVIFWFLDFTNIMVGRGSGSFHMRRSFGLGIALIERAKYAFKR